MDHAIKYTSDSEILKKINICRLFKKVIYPFKLVGFPGRNHTTSYTNDFDKSHILWDMNFYDILLPSGKCWCMWRKFKQWLYAQCVIYDNNIDLSTIST